SPCEEVVRTDKKLLTHSLLKTADEQGKKIKQQNATMKQKATGKSTTLGNKTTTTGNVDYSAHSGGDPHPHAAG
ncbi:unnamed protein product, partial [Amoebophrya sp. A120]